MLRPLRPVLWGTAAGVLLVPLCIIAGRSLGNFPIAATETIAGSLLGTLFLASTALVAAVFYNKADLKTAIVYTYVLKISLLLIGGFLVPWGPMDRVAVGLAVVISALTYIALTIALQPKASPDAD